MSLRKVPFSIGSAVFFAMVAGTLHASLLPPSLIAGPHLRGSQPGSGVEATMLAGGAFGLLVGVLAQSVAERYRGRFAAARMRSRWKGVRRVPIALARGPVRVAGRIRVLSPATSGIDRKACAAFAIRRDLVDGGVESYARTGELELRDDRGGVAHIGAVPCEIAIPMEVRQYELRIADGARVVVYGVARTDGDGRVHLSGDDDRPLLLSTREAEEGGG